jgi:hypothetical protein
MDQGNIKEKLKAYLAQKHMELDYVKHMTMGFDDPEEAQLYRDKESFLEQLCEELEDLLKP